MANNLKYTLLVLDKFTSPIERAVRATEKLSNKVQKFSKKACKALKRVSKRFGKFGEKVDSVGKSMSLNLSAPLGLIGYKAIKGAGQFERYERVLTTMLGSTKLAKERLTELENIAIFTPFELDQVVDLGNKLQALGKYSKANVMLLGDLAAAAGKPIEQVSGAYAKLVSGQKGIAVDMFRDLLITTDDWVKATGKGITKNGELMATTEEMVAAIPRIMKSKNFLGMMESQSKGLEGIISNLSDATSKAFRSLGQAFVISLDLKGKIKGLSEQVDKWTESFNNLSPATQKIISYLGLFLFVTGPLLIIIGKISFGVSALIKVIVVMPSLIGGILTAFKILSAFLLTNPIGVALLIAIGIFKLFGGSFIKLVKDTIEVAKVIWEGIKYLGTAIKEFFLAKIEMILSAWNKVKGVFDKLAFWKDKDSSIDVNQNTKFERTSSNKSSVDGNIVLDFLNVPQGATSQSKMSNNTGISIGTNMSFAGGF